MKLIAMCSMIVDHTGVVLFPHMIDAQTYIWMRAVGRIAFPVYAFLIVNGYRKTHDVKRYLTRLIAFAVISQIPFTLTAHALCFSDAGLSIALRARWFVCLIFILVTCVGWYTAVRSDWSVLWVLFAMTLAVLQVEYRGVQIIGGKLNVFYTLALALALIALLDAVSKQERDILRLLMQALALFGAFFLIRDNADYRTLGAALIVSIWIARGSLFSQAGVIILWCVVEYLVETHPIVHFLFAISSLAPILLYNGKQGRPLKLMFYAVYPLHLMLLAALNIACTLE
jgi:TraX protein.